MKGEKKKREAFEGKKEKGKEIKLFLHVCLQSNNTLGIFTA